MEQYFLYVAISCATIASPGPGVILTMTNAVRYRFVGAFPSIFGVAVGMLCIAALSATSLAIILATSAFAFTLLKFIGAAYLIYLGIKQWRSSEKVEANKTQANQRYLQRFRQGLLITLFNPKPIFFFMALFPQFIDHSKSYLSQFIALAVTFSVLVVIIHSLYAFFSGAAKSKLSTSRGSKLIGKVSGSFYMLFGIGLATASK